MSPTIAICYANNFATFMQFTFVTSAYLLNVIRTIQIRVFRKFQCDPNVSFSLNVHILYFRNLMQIGLITHTRGWRCKAKRILKSRRYWRRISVVVVFSFRSCKRKRPTLIPNSKFLLKPATLLTKGESSSSISI